MKKVTFIVLALTVMASGLSAKEIILNAGRGAVTGVKTCS